MPIIVATPPPPAICVSLSLKDVSFQFELRICLQSLYSHILPFSCVRAPLSRLTVIAAGIMSSTFYNTRSRDHVTKYRREKFSVIFLFGHIRRNFHDINLHIINSTWLNMLFHTAPAQAVNSPR
mmetsp:Transcript_36164/g.36393  ORF Transcript_36164/g.36393 Transcript_36164/m.36393 type:complete len:124 (-) Transcript_36164:14-385(-)